MPLFSAALCSVVMSTDSDTHCDRIIECTELLTVYLIFQMCSVTVRCTHLIHDIDNDMIVFL